MNIKDFCDKMGSIKTSISKVIIGKEKVVDLILTAILSEGHVILEDVPGVGKTLLAKTLAKSLDLDFKRIQFTPDLLPSDVLGVNIYNQKTSTFDFKPGPISCNLLLADEINRATPKTQSSLLEAMEERQYTIEGITRKQELPFIVLATQNPVEMEGTFPLPEAQLDRFLMKIKVGYPSLEEEKILIHRFQKTNPLDEITPVLSKAEILELQNAVKDVFMHEEIEEYLLTLVRSTREHPSLSLGASPRASLCLSKCARALAAVKGREYVIPDDVKELAEPILGHRILMDSQSFLKNITPENVIGELLLKIPAPVERLEDWGK